MILEKISICFVVVLLLLFITVESMVQDHYKKEVARMVIFWLTMLTAALILIIK